MLGVLAWVVTLGKHHFRNSIYLSSPSSSLNLLGTAKCISLAFGWSGGLSPIHIMQYENLQSFVRYNCYVLHMLQATSSVNGTNKRKTPKACYCRDSSVHTVQSYWTTAKMPKWSKHIVIILFAFNVNKHCVSASYIYAPWTSVTLLNRTRRRKRKSNTNLVLCGFSKCRASLRVVNK